METADTSGSLKQSSMRQHGETLTGQPARPKQEAEWKDVQMNVFACTWDSSSEDEIVRGIDCLISFSFCFTIFAVIYVL